MQYGRPNKVLLLLSLFVVLSTIVTADWEKGLAAREAGDLQTAHDEWKASAQAGHSRSQYNLALMYLEGVESDGATVVGKDISRAVELMSHAAAQEHLEATYYLGIFYTAGMGVEKDDEEAFCWFERSARQGYPRGYFALGRMYFEGRGRQQDLAKAHAFLTLGQTLGHEKSAQLLEEVLSQLSDLSFLEKSMKVINEWGSADAPVPNCKYPPTVPDADPSEVR